MTASAIQVSAQTVEHMLHQDIHTAESLELLLQQELDNLKTRDADKLQTLLNEKQTLMHKLEQSARQRSQWTRFLTERTGMSAEQCWDQLLQELDNPELITLWEQFQGKIQSCKSNNEINGRIIGRGQRTLKQLLGILRGQFMETPKLYTAAGDTGTQKNSHTVIKV